MALSVADLDLRGVSEALARRDVTSVQATEESIVNAMVAARDMDGVDGHFAKALPHAELKKLLARYGRGTTPR